MKITEKFKEMKDELHEVWKESLRNIKKHGGWCMGIKCCNCPFSSNYNNGQTCETGIFYTGDAGEDKLTWAEEFLRILENNEITVER